MAGDKFIEKLIDYGKENLFELYDYAVEQLKKAKVKSALKDRIISKLAVIWITVKLMKEFFELDIDCKAMTSYIIKLLKRFTLETTPENKLLNILQEEVAVNKSKFAYNGSPSFGACIGAIDENDDFTDITVYQKEFESLMYRYGIRDYKKSLKVLKDKGVLLPESDRLTTRVVVSNSMRVNCYRFRLNKAEEPTE